MNGMAQNALASLTGNIPKAVLCVRKLSDPATAANPAAGTAALQQKLLRSTEGALNNIAGGTGASQTFNSMTTAKTGKSASGGKTVTPALLAGTGYLALEVQYNPNTIRIETQGGEQVQYSGGDVGGGSINQMTQVKQPVFTQMSFQLIFDAMNPHDAFMMSNLAPTVGNAVSAVGNVVNKKRQGGYTVQPQMDGLMGILTQTETKHVIFFWGKMCFRGEVVSVSNRYTMFNKAGNPIRGTVDITIRQGTESKNAQDQTYWDQAFTRAFGNAGANAATGMAGKFSQATNNNLLNLNI